MTDERVPLTQEITEEEQQRFDAVSKDMMKLATDIANDIAGTLNTAITEGNFDYIHAAQQIERLFRAMQFSGVEGLAVLCAVVARVAASSAKWDNNEGHDSEVIETAICNAVGFAALIVLASKHLLVQEFPDETARNAVIKEMLEKVKQTAASMEEAAEATKQ